MRESLSPLELRKARRRFNTYSVLNSLSFLVLSGNVLTLFSLKLGANSSYIGLLNSFGYFTFFAMLIGMMAIRKRRIVTVFARNWFFRNVSMLPLLAAPLLLRAGYDGRFLYRDREICINDKSGRIDTGIISARLFCRQLCG
jgi:hypothetical protein